MNRPFLRQLFFFFFFFFFVSFKSERGDSATFAPVLNLKEEMDQLFCVSCKNWKKFSRPFLRQFKMEI